MSDPRGFIESVLSHLDRCEHGRHSADGCYYCPGGVSSGNLLFKPGALIGHSVHGTEIRIPEGLDDV